MRQLPGSRLVRFATALALVAAASAAGAADSNVSSDKQAVLDHLERTRQLFLASIEGLSPEQWSWKPSPERWSVAECAEHITRAESFLRELTRPVITEPADPVVLAKSHGKSAQVLQMIVDRSQKFQAPEPINPDKQGDVRAFDEIVRDFNFERGRTHEMVAAVDDLEAHAKMHFGFQELDLAGWAYFLSGHTERHTLQIEEVKAAPGFPKR